MPDGLDLVTAATVPLNSLTATQALDLLAAVQGTEMLVTGASGAVGGFAVQLAAQAGLRVTAVCAPGDEEWGRAAGAVQVLVGRDDVPTDKQFPSVLDAVPLGQAVLPAVEDGGRVAFTRRIEPDKSKNAEQIVFLVHSDASALARLLALVAQDRLTTRVARTLPLDEAARAHELVEKGGLRGKVVLCP